jgi:hypothetical protein
MFLFEKGFVQGVEEASTPNLQASIPKISNYSATTIEKALRLLE